jgi:hypothetical protein
MAAKWAKGRGLLGPLEPLLGVWVSEPADQTAPMPGRCIRRYQAFGKSWIQLNSEWELGSYGTYRETAFFGPADSENSAVVLGFFSFTNDGKRSQGRLADGSDAHPQAIAFEARMPQGLARSIYWPAEDGDGFQFAVESRSAKGWKRFLLQRFRASVSSWSGTSPA